MEEQSALAADQQLVLTCERISQSSALALGSRTELAASVAIGRPVVSGLLPKLIFLTYVAHVS